MTAPGRYGLVVVGSGPAALSAAGAYRRCGGGGAVAVVSDDRDAPYERPPLSKGFLRGETDAPKLALADPGWDASDVELRLASPAVRLDPAARVLALVDGGVLAYDRCVLATGSGAARPAVPGAEHRGVFVLRSLADAERLRAGAAAAGSAVVVGSGFIGCEVAASLASLGISVTMLTQEDEPQQERLGAEAGQRIAGWLRAVGVRLVTGAAVSRIEAGARVETASGGRAEGDLVVLACGNVPQVGLAADAGLAVRGGRVLVDASMRTSAAGVLAAGDVALAHNAAAGRRLVVEHWGEALAMGEVAGTVAAGGAAEWAQAPGFWSDICGRTLKHVAWGDGFDSARLVDHGGEAFTVWYGRGGVTVGALTYEADGDYDRGRRLVESGAALPVPGTSS